MKILLDGCCLLVRVTNLWYIKKCLLWKCIYVNVHSPVNYPFGSCPCQVVKHLSEYTISDLRSQSLKSDISVSKQLLQLPLSVEVLHVQSAIYKLTTLIALWQIVLALPHIDISGDAHWSRDIVNIGGDVHIIEYRHLNSAVNVNNKYFLCIICRLRFKWPCLKYHNNKYIYYKFRGELSS